MNYIYLLPVASLLEIAGVLTLLTNESIVGPVDLGFSIPYLVSADVQGVMLFIIGALLAVYSILQVQERRA